MWNWETRSCSGSCRIWFRKRSLEPGLIGIWYRCSITFETIDFRIREMRFRKLHNISWLLPWNRSLVFYNNTSAWPVSLTESGSSNKFDRFDTILWIQTMGSESYITYFDYHSGTLHRYSITTLVQVLIRFSNTGYGFLYLQNILRLLPRNHSLVFCNNTSASFDTILEYRVLVPKTAEHTSFSIVEPHNRESPP